MYEMLGSHFARHRPASLHQDGPGRTVARLPIQSPRRHVLRLWRRLFARRVRITRARGFSCLRAHRKNLSEEPMNSITMLMRNKKLFLAPMLCIAVCLLAGCTTPNPQLAVDSGSLTLLSPDGQI